MICLFTGLEFPPIEIYFLNKPHKVMDYLVFCSLFYGTGLMVAKLLK